MTNLSLSAFTELPSVQRFLGVLVDSLAERRSTLVLLPLGIDPVEVWSKLRGELWRRDFWFVEASLPNMPQGQRPVKAVSEMLGLDRSLTSGTPHTIANLMTVPDLPDVIQLAGFEQLPEAARIEWVVFVTEWARTCQSVADCGRKPTALCIVVPALTVLPVVPKTDVHLSVNWWWGFPSALEVHLLCRLRAELDGWDTLTRWRGHLVSALTGSDMSLAGYLWDDVQLGVQHLSDRLRSFGQQRGWDAEGLYQWGADQLVASSGSMGASPLLSPPVQWHNLWAHGALIWTPEYGLELHTAALAVLDKEEELRHRLWRGQAELLLPLIDQIRLRLCEHLTRSHGADWPVRWHQPASLDESVAVRENPLACQWGYLEWLLKNCDGLRSERYWLPVVSRARWIRNEMAHYRPVIFRDFDAFWRDAERVTA